MTLRCSECGDENWVACQPGDADGTPDDPQTDLLVYCADCWPWPQLWAPILEVAQ